MAQTQNSTALKDTGVTVAPEDVINDILPFCAQGQPGRDLLSQTDYAQDMQRSLGHQPGIARAALANKQARQVSHMAAGLAQFLARRYGPGVVDDGDLDKVEAALVAALDAVLNSPEHLATLLRAGLVQPDGVTTTVDEDGLLSALGGNLLLNDETWITESGTFTAPVKGWYHLLLFDGGWSGKASASFKQATGGKSGRMRQATVYLEQDQEVSVIIGAGGLPASAADNSNGVAPGTTHFGDISTGNGPYYPENIGSPYVNMSGFYAAHTTGMGLGAGIAAAFSDTTTQEYANALCSATGHWGGGGGAVYAVKNSGGGYKFALGKGAPGSVLVRWHNPAKAGGPEAAPALFSARRMAVRRVEAAPVTVNLYDPETGQGSVWREEDAEAKLAEGLIAEAAWVEICAAKRAEDYAAWLADPDTEAERFEMLRTDRDAKLAATDYLVAPDYPLTDELRAVVIAYRQKLRDLPAQEGAPWDGGGELTPWPEMPAVVKVQEA